MNSTGSQLLLGSSLGVQVLDPELLGTQRFRTNDEASRIGTRATTHHPSVVSNHTVPHRTIIDFLMTVTKFYCHNSPVPQKHHPIKPSRLLLASPVPQQQHAVVTRHPLVSSTVAEQEHALETADRTDRSQQGEN